MVIPPEAEPEDEKSLLAQLEDWAAPEELQVDGAGEEKKQQQLPTAPQAQPRSSAQAAAALLDVDPRAALSVVLTVPTTVPALVYGTPLITTVSPGQNVRVVWLVWYGSSSSV